MILPKNTIIPSSEVLFVFLFLPTFREKNAVTKHQRVHKKLAKSS